MADTTILLIEDDTQICEVIVDHFTAKSGGDIKLLVANNGSDGSRLINEGGYDLVLLDVMLPDIDGFSLCREIRRKSSVPVLFLTARAREEDVLYGYELGCDDYIIKPFSLAALYAKTCAMIKRIRSGEQTFSAQEQTKVVCGAITLELTSMQVYVNGSAVDLAPKEYALLKYLMEHRGWVVERDTLLNKLWGYDYFGSDRVVDNHIKKLRKALGEAGQQIKTVITKGYKLTD